MDTEPADISDDELAAEAIAADPDPCLDGAVPFDQAIGRDTDGDLPAWYMPAPMAGGARLVGWRRSVILTFVASLLVIEAAGLCTTFGPHF